jgi:hypothetical protein
VGLTFDGVVIGVVTAHGWLIAGGLAISGVGVLAAAVFGLRGQPVDRFATYASSPNGTDEPTEPASGTQRWGCARLEKEGDPMASEGTRQEFEQIVERLTTDYPSLGRPPGQPWSRPVLVAVLVTGGVVWGLLSVAMVAWGWRGVVLTGVVAGLAALAAIVDARRRRDG